MIVTELKLQKIRVPRETTSDTETEESSEDNGIEIIRSVQLQPGEGLIRTGSGAESGAPHEHDHVCRPSTEEATSQIVIPVSVGAIKPSSNLPSWGILPPVEESEAEAEVDIEPEVQEQEVQEPEVQEQEVQEPEVQPKYKVDKEIKLEVLFELGSVEEGGDEEQKDREKFAAAESESFDYSSEANNEILTKAYKVINENDDLLTALDKLEYHIEEGSDPLAEEAGQKELKQDYISEVQTQPKSDEKLEIKVGKHRINLNNKDQERDEFGFIVQSEDSKRTEVKEKDKCDSKLPKPGKSTSSTKCDETQKSKATKAGTVKQKEGNRLIRALNWVSKLPGRISADKQTKKHDQKHEKQEKQEKRQEKQEKEGDDDDYGFFIKLHPRPLSERQSHPLKKLSPKSDEKSESDKKTEVKVEEEQAPESRPKEKDPQVVTEVLSSFQPEVEDTHFQDNLRRFENISLANEQNNGENVCAREEKGESNGDDEWEPGPRQTGSLPNLAGEFLSTSPTMERIREYMMQDESDDSSLDEFLLIPMPTDYEQTVGAASQPNPPKQQSELNTSDVLHDSSRENISASDVITSPNTCSDLTSDADEKLPLPKLRMETTSLQKRGPISTRESDTTRLPRPAQTYTNQTNVPVTTATGSAMGKRGPSGWVVPRAIRGARHTPPYATPPRPIKGNLQVPTGRNMSRDTSRGATTSGRGVPSTRGSGRGSVTHARLFAQRMSGQFTAKSPDTGNKISVKDKLSVHGPTTPPPPIQHVSTVVGRSSMACQRLSQQPGSTRSRGLAGFHQEQHHYIASHKSTNTYTVNPGLIHKAAAFNRPPGYSSRGGIRSTSRSPALQKRGKSNISSCSSSPGTKAGANTTPVLADLDQSKPPQVKHTAGEPGVVQRVQAHITLLPSDTRTTDATHCSTHARSVSQQQQQQRPLAGQEVDLSQAGSISETAQDGGSGNWMDSGVQMDFTDES